MFPTKNDLPEIVRQKSVDLLQTRLADAIDLTLQTKQAHWNIKGPHFFSLHELFDTFHTEAGTYVDLIAERIMQLGGSTEGTVEMVAQQTSLPRYPLAATDGSDHVDAISTSFAAFGKHLLEAIDRSVTWNDPATTDLLTEIYRGVQKNLWFIESHESLSEQDVKIKGVA